MIDPVPVAQHPSLVALRRRTRLRWLLERGRLGLLWGLAGGLVISLGGRMAGYPEWPLALLGWAVLAVATAVAIGASRCPGVWEAARAADELGLQERVTSALYAAGAGLPVAPLLASDASRTLSRVVLANYRLIPSPRPWRLLLVAALVLAGAVLLPVPAIGDGARRSADARMVAESRLSVQALQATVAQPATPEPLGQATSAELEALDKQLADARDVTEAARALEEAQVRLAGMGGAEEYAWQRALEGMATAWGGEPNLGPLARALESRNPEAVERALDGLAGRLGEMSPEERQRLQRELQAGANAAREVPAIAGALRQAAGEAGAGSGSTGSGTPEEGARQFSDLASMLSQGVATSAGLRAVQQAVAGLGQARAALGAPSGSASGASGTAAAGPSSGSAAGGQGGDVAAAPGGSSGSGAGSGSAGQGGSGSGSGAGSGNGSGGTGGAGSGAGAGAGAGGGPSPGRPGAGSSGATLAGGRAAPNQQGPTTYERIYAPSLMGGEGGPQVRSSGQTAGASGETVELPNSPLTLGELRPYDEVYGQYESEARQSLSRQSLPPALQGLVQRYFSSIAPDKE